MSKFNVQKANSKQKKSIRPDTLNKENFPAYSRKPELDLVTRLLSSFVNNQYYSSTNTQIKELVSIIDEIKDKKFIAQATIYARDEFNMRSITHVMMCELIRNIRSDKNNVTPEWLKNAIVKTVVRVDDILEILAYWDSLQEKNIPNILKKGLREAFNKFDNYQLAKYAGRGKSTFSLIDAIRILHPKPTERNADTLEKLIKEGKATADTRQTQLTQAIQSALTTTDENVSSEERENIKQEAKREAWIKYLDNPKKVAYFDLLKNLISIMNDCPEKLDDAIAILTDSERISKSRVLPFRFYNAYRAVATESASSDTRKLMSALSTALDLSCKNVPNNFKNTLVVVDISDSMRDPVSASSDDVKRNKEYGKNLTLRCFEAGALFGAILAKHSNCDILMFASKAGYLNYNPQDTSISIAELISKNMGKCGYGTDFHSIFKTINKAYDRIVIFTDLQGFSPHTNYEINRCHSDIQKMKSTFNCDPYIHSIDLRSYGTTMFPSKDVKYSQLSGYSEKIFELLQNVESDPNILINIIEKIDI
jgi:hypothetical protein